MTQFTNISPFAEEQMFLPQEQCLQEILAQFQQIVPTNFVPLVTKEHNYMCATTGWKEPVCERYGFTYEGKWIQLDIPQWLLGKLEIPLGEEVPYPVYLLPSVLARELSFGAITIENEKEIFIQKPLSEKNLVVELEKWLGEIFESREQFSQLSNTEQLNQVTILSFQREITQLQQDKQALETELKGEKQLSHSQKQIQQTKIQYSKVKLEEKEQDLVNLQLINKEKDNDISTLTSQINNLTTERNSRPNITQAQYNALVQERNNLNQQLTTANNTIATLQNTERVINSNLARVSQELENKKRENNQIQTELNNLRNINTTSTLQINDLQSQLDNLNNLLKQEQEKNVFVVFNDKRKEIRETLIPYVDKRYDVNGLLRDILYLLRNGVPYHQ